MMSPISRLRPWLALGLVAIIIGIVGAVGWLSFQEQDNRFCGSCHTQPETAYLERYARATATNFADDLASFHHRKKDVRCIDCHVGEGILGRSAVVSLATWNALKHIAGIARQPAVIVLPIQNEACVKCHLAQVTKPGFANHMHNKQFDGQDPVPFLRCTDCHINHRAGDERTAFQFRDAIFPQCEHCHATVGKGPRGLSR